MKLTPLPLGRLVTRMLREFEAKESIFDLPRRNFFLGDPNKDLSVPFHSRRAASPLGPSAGPHTQLAQNIVLSWLGGCRIMELKTIQIMDALAIPRPCIDMRNVGYNVEWSQELRLEESLEEYVKASMLIRILEASGLVSMRDNFSGVIYDMSVGYDLKGIQSDRVQTFIKGMMDARGLVERLRSEIPSEYRKYRDLDFPAKISDTLTLSTFHGCPPHEIAQIVEFLMTRLGLSCVIKLNPTLLGPKELRGLLNDELGFMDIHVPDEAFEKDTQWDQAVEFIERLNTKSKELGVSFGVKFCNTLVTEHKGNFLPVSEKLKYLSGPPLHVLAIRLAQRLRETFGDRIPVSFSGGINRWNFPDAVSLGLVPVTVCSDLLKSGGYQRLKGYFEELVKRMDQIGASNISEFILKANGKEQDLSKAILKNTSSYARTVALNPKYSKKQNSSLPKKIGNQLKLFDCLACGKCVQVCPNDANFAYTMEPVNIPEADLRIEKKLQFANFADFCNECGNCDIFCPEDGGPYLVKPRIFGSLKAWQDNANRDGFFFEKDPEGREIVYGRFKSKEYKGTFSTNQLTQQLSNVTAPIDLTRFHIMNELRKSLFRETQY